GQERRPRPRRPGDLLMDVNGTKFQLLLGRDDWKSCALEDVEWADRGELTLHPEAFRFPPARFDRPPRVEDRRGAGRDRFGNWYWIAADARTVLVDSSGTGATTVFWPGHEDCPPEPARLGVFGPREAAPPPPRPPVLSGA